MDSAPSNIPATPKLCKFDSCIIDFQKCLLGPIENKLDNKVHFIQQINYAINKQLKEDDLLLIWLIRLGSYFD